MSQNRNKQKGFTLIELVAVIIILGVLIRLAVPNFINTTQIIGGQELLNNVGMVQYRAAMQKVKIEDSLETHYGLIEVDPGIIQAAYDNNRIFDKDGHVEVVVLDGYYDLTGSELLNNIQGYNSGTFLIRGDNIFFVSDKDIKIDFNMNNDGG